MPGRHPTANASQRHRRAKLARVDYYPSPDALAIIQARRESRYPLNIASGILDAILLEWAELKGLREPSPPPPRPEFLHATRANDSGGIPGCLMLPQSNLCGAKSCRTARPCCSKPIPGKRRCKWHGGLSTGPKTVEGKAKALANLRQHQLNRSALSNQGVGH